ncbi:MAG: helix-turn-helix domain-containing protein [Ruminococcaceae bacterium]|nr:helix-turn-helix domain-containing protein [Oscillospiraceae bacterium]
MNIHLKIQELRKNAGLSQEALAEQLGVSRQAVSKWESGINIPDIDKIIAISKIFGVSLSELLTGEKENVSVAAETPVPDEKYEELLQQHLMQVDAMLKESGRKKRSGWSIAFRIIAAVVICYLVLFYVDKLQRMENNINNLQSNVGNIRTDINHQIYSIQKEISESLKKEYGLISDYTLDYRDMDFPRRTVVLDISASPRLWNEGDSMAFIVEADGEQLSCEGVYNNGTVYAEIEVPLSDNIQVSALITNGGTVKQEKIDELHELLSMHLLEVNGHGSIRSSRVLGDDQLTMSGDITVYAHSRLYDESQPVLSRIKSATFELIENGKTTQTVDLLAESMKNRPYDSPIDNVRADFDYTVGTIERTMKAGDTFDYVVTIVDNNDVTYKGILESIMVTDDLSVEHNKRDYGDFEVTLPDKVE